MKKNLFTLLALLLLMTGTKAFAHDIAVANVDGKTIYYVWTNNNTELAVSYRGSSSDQYSKEYSGILAIPESVTYDGQSYSVTSIGDGAFYGCSGLTSVTIPNRVTSIGDNVFSGCSGLTSITIPNSVTSIGSSTFYGCSGLLSVVVGNGISSLPDYVFATGNNIKSLTIGSGVLSISSNAFYYNSSRYYPIKTIWLTNTPPSGYSYAAGKVNYVANNLYTSLSNKTEYKFLSSLFEVDGVKYVPVSPSERTCDAIDCLYNDGAENIHIGKTVTNQGITLTVKQVHPYAFYGNPYIKDVDLSFDGNVPDRAFQGCTALESVKIGEKITSIGQYAFSDCSSLQGIVIPNAVTSIGQYGFQNCSAMTTVKMGTGVTGIEAYTFAGCSSLPEIHIPLVVTSVSNYVFSGCSSLKTVIMEDRETVLNLGSNGSSPLFSGCPLDSVYIGGNINYNTGSSYGYSPFYRNTSLRTVVITDKETEISPNEFYGCTNLQSFTVGDGVENFGDWAFSGCSSLKSLTFGTQLKAIGKEVFSDCTAVTQIISRAATPPTCGSQALDDINKWTCTLSVPPGGVEAYQAADQWKDFFFIQEENTSDLWFRLTYMVDGEVYKVYNQLYGTAITPEPEPVKDGYIFSGWSPIPETMPARDVIIVGSFSEDPQLDLSQTDNVIYINSAEARVGSELTLSIMMKNNAAIRGFQFDLYLPDGVTAVEAADGRIKASLTTDRLPEDDEHTLTVNVLQDGAIRFLCGSQYNETFTGTDGEIITIQLNIAEDMEAGVYPMVLRNIKLTETNIDKFYVADGITAMLTVNDYVTGDINGDDTVDVSDYIGIANYIMDLAPAGFNEKAADVNEDGVIDVSDYIGVANIILTGNVYGNTNQSRISRHGYIE